MEKIFSQVFRRMSWLLLVVLLLFAVSCTPAEPSVPAEKQCQTDDDCVPSACCHPAEAVNKAYAPDCRGILCSMECAPGTLDCGQGEVKCIKKECRAVIS